MAPRKSKVAWEETFTGRIISLLSLSITGFTKIFWDIMPLEGNDSVLFSIMLPVLLTLPIALLSVVIITDGQYTWSSDLHILLTPGIGFLVVFRCTAAFNRFWEVRTRHRPACPCLHRAPVPAPAQLPISAAMRPHTLSLPAQARGHISKAVKGCRTLSIIVITQYHRHAGKPGLYPALVSLSPYTVAASAAQRLASLLPLVPPASRPPPTPPRRESRRRHPQGRG